MALNNYGMLDRTGPGGPDGPSGDLVVVLSGYLKSGRD